MKKIQRFSYLSREQVQNIRKGIVSYLIYGPSLIKKGKVIAIQEVNKLDRLELAEKMLNESIELSIFRDLIEKREVDEYDLLDDIADYIDLKLPSTWLRKKNYTETGSIVSYNGIENIPDAIFQKNENYQIDKLIVEASKNKVPARIRFANQDKEEYFEKW